jgi:glycine cleavage system H protein
VKIRFCEYPDDLLYDVEAGTWARREEGERFRVGVTPALSWTSGGLSSVSFKVVGEPVRMGTGLGSIEGPRHFDLVRAPFDCVLEGTNQPLLSTPRLVNKDPYGEGWFAMVRRTGEESILVPLKDAQAKIAESLDRLGVRCFDHFPDIEVIAVGAECSAALSQLDGALEKAEKGSIAHVVSDDPAGREEMKAWEKRTGNKLVESRAEGTLNHFIVEKS